MCVGDSHVHDAQWVLCYQILGKSSMVQHLHTKHDDCKDRPITVFKCKCDELKHSQTNLTSVVKGEQGNVCEESYKLSYHIARCVEAFMIAAHLIIP